MMLRGRIATITACVVAAAVVGTGAITWFATRHHLLAQLDQTLLDKGLPTLTTIHEGATKPTLADKSLLCDPPEHQLQRFLEGIQLLRADGTECVPDGVDGVVTTATDRAVPAVTLRNGITESGVPVRVVLRPVGGGDVVAISRSLVPVEETLSGLRTLLILVCLAGVVTAGAIGLLLARRTLAPMARLWRTPAARALPGSGLGLAIVANTVHAHRGTVRFVDPPPGWGACVHIELPPRDHH